MLRSLVHNYIKTNYQFELVQQIVKSNKIDHVALRFKSGSNPLINKITEGYQLQPEIYTFRQFNAMARWYKQNINNGNKSSDIQIPRLFISYYVGDFKPTIKTPDMYKNISNTNSYLAWTSLFEGHVNHIALEVDNIYTSTENCIKNGLKMNTEGELYKISRDNQLYQTATLAMPIEYKFPNGHQEQIPYTFVELVQRINNREGFEEDNARQIFSSTNIQRN